jgi:hypothetical protein
VRCGVWRVWQATYFGRLEAASKQHLLRQEVEKYLGPQVCTPNKSSAGAGVSEGVGLLVVSQNTAVPRLGAPSWACQGLGIIPACSCAV